MILKDPKLERYIENHTTPESELLNRINRQTHLEVLDPGMLSGHLQGRFLAMISQIVKPKLVLEIGTFTGYSAICLAEGLQKDGKIITIDNNYELEDRVVANFKDAGCEDKIKLMIGNALEIIPHLDHQFDLVYLDADKNNYLSYYELCLERLVKGGLIIADNVLWKGKVADPEEIKDHNTLHLREFNQKIQQDSRVENVMLSIRDGLSLIRKL